MILDVSLMEGWMIKEIHSKAPLYRAAFQKNFTPQQRAVLIGLVKIGQGTPDMIKNAAGMYNQGQDVFQSLEEMVGRNVLERGEGRYSFSPSHRDLAAYLVMTFGGDSRRRTSDGN